MCTFLSPRPFCNEKLVNQLHSITSPGSLMSHVKIMRPTSVLVQLQWLLCAYVGTCVSSVAVIHSLPWHVSCPARCVCQIKPWFSAESVYHKAPTVDCNDLLLTELPSPLPHDTHTLRLQSNLLSGLPSDELPGLPNLTELDLSQNRFGGVPSWSPRPGLHSLLSLHMEENQLALLPQASFSSYPVLQELFLSHNRLHSLAAGAFAGLESLLRLHMNNNRLTTVDPEWFKPLPRLEVLMLGGNPVEVLPEQAFQALRSLRSLMLGGMGLRVLKERALDGLDSLECLSFYDNLLTKVPTQALRRVPGLKFLDLNKNRIRLVETGGFRDMIHLKELGLNNMEDLVSIERAALENLPELTKLEITNNPRLSFIHPHAFLHLSRLESLMLNSNSLSALHHHTLLSLPGLQELSLHSNPLRCDCLFRWAADGALHRHAHHDARPPEAAAHAQAAGAGSSGPRTVRFIQPQATLCSEPPELRARRVKEVSSREMSASCLPLIPAGPLPAYVGVREGTSLALHCRALAEPQPKVYWVTPSGVRIGPASGLAHSQGPPAAETPGHSLSPDTPRAHAARNHSTHYRLLPEGTLEITGVTPKDAGLFTCVAENALGADTRSVTVVVHCIVRRRPRQKQLPANLRRHPHEAAGAGLQAREVGQHHMVLSWTNGHNRPMTRLFWRAINPDAAPVPTYTTRILAGTQSFNLTHLVPKTLYRVCLHLGAGPASEHERRTERGSGRPQCVTVKTEEAPPSQQMLPLGPELSSTVLVLLFLVVILLIVASQGLDRRSAERREQCHVDLLQEVKDHGPPDQTPGDVSHPGAREEKAPFRHDC
ncbi:leucine-rich repeat neuronal protein 2-like [Gadus macrocephalus]|uniref:leucine-rich repeat neuronal protein 2-like n=1 Tax=Gadus macrocephalus TaxID=80720 RepID=UPI0028CBA4C8|nr:leucine-rich repeat neuronal protein 2-like [Gadus macrocephalus]XP_059924975.1 leucine-rich repeat neuronal protein 2-like [Gadus macrocephalus]